MVERRRLTADEFEAAVPLLSRAFKPENIEIARKYLVEGLTSAEIAAGMPKKQLHRQSVHQSVNQVLNAHERLLAAEAAAAKEPSRKMKLVPIRTPQELVPEFIKRIAEYQVEAQARRPAGTARTAGRAAKVLPTKRTAVAPPRAAGKPAGRVAVKKRVVKP